MMNMNLSRVHQFFMAALLMGMAALFFPGCKDDAVECAVEGCIACDEADICVTCESGYTPNDGSCEEDATSTCSVTNCDDDSCDGDTCTECDDGYTLSDDGSSCEDSTCSVANCDDDSCDGDTCTACDDGYTLSSDGSSCDDNSSCDVDNCAECTESSSCDTCDDGYFVQDSAAYCCSEQDGAADYDKSDCSVTECTDGTLSDLPTQLATGDSFKVTCATVEGDTVCTAAGTGTMANYNGVTVTEITNGDATETLTDSYTVACDDYDNIDADADVDCSDYEFTYTVPFGDWGCASGYINSQDVWPVESDTCYSTTTDTTTGSYTIASGDVMTWDEVSGGYYVVADEDSADVIVGTDVTVDADRVLSVVENSGTYTVSDLDVEYTVMDGDVMTVTWDSATSTATITDTDSSTFDVGSAETESVTITWTSGDTAPITHLDTIYTVQDGDVMSVASGTITDTASSTYTLGSSDSITLEQLATGVFTVTTSGNTPSTYAGLQVTYIDDGAGTEVTLEAIEYTTELYELTYNTPSAGALEGTTIEFFDGIAVTDTDPLTVDSVLQVTGTYNGLIATQIDGTAVSDSNDGTMSEDQVITYNTPSTGSYTGTVIKYIDGTAIDATASLTTEQVLQAAGTYDGLTVTAASSTYTLGSSDSITLEQLATGVFTVTTSGNTPSTYAGLQVTYIDDGAGTEVTLEAIEYTTELYELTFNSLVDAYAFADTDTFTYDTPSAGSYNGVTISQIDGSAVAASGDAASNVGSSIDFTLTEVTDGNGDSQGYLVAPLTSAGDTVSFGCDDPADTA